MIKVFDDFISERYANEIEQRLFGNFFPWYFAPDVSVDASLLDQSKYKLRPAAFHMLRQNSITNSNFYEFIEPMIIAAADKAGIEYKDVYKCRAFLQYPLADSIIKNSKPDPAHIDDEEPHIVVLYYVMDSDGDTIIYDKKWDGIEDRHVYGSQYDNWNIEQKVTPKKGRVVVFDGRYFHTAEQPRNNLRCVLNANLLT